jgi:hypothetical protein
MRNDMANKYNNKKVVIDGITFDSIKESQRYGELKLMEKAGKIRDLEIHPEIELQPSFTYRGNGIRAIKYEPDFWYVENGVQIFEDLKGFETQLFRAKWKMLLYKFRNSPVEFRIVR